MAIKSYKLQSGETRYEATAHLETNPITGKKKRAHKRGFRRKRDAQAWIDSVRVLGLEQENKHVSVQMLASEWLSSYKPTVIPSTYTKTETLMRLHIVPYFGADTPITTITSKQCQALVNDWAVHFVNHKMMRSYLYRIFKYALKKKYISIDPCADLERPKPPAREKKEPVIWTADQLNVFLAEAKNYRSAYAYPLVRLLTMTGLRRQEIIALQWKDFEPPILHIRRALTQDEDKKPTIGNTKTKKSVRDIGLDAETICVLEEWKALQKATMHRQQTDDTFIFSSEEGRRLSIATPYKIIQKVADRAGLPRTSPHKLRHAHCTILIDAQVNIKDVQYRLGHSDIQTTLNIYAHANQDKTKAADAFVKALNGVPDGVPL